MEKKECQENKTSTIKILQPKRATFGNYWQTKLVWIKWSGLTKDSGKK